MKRKTLLTEDFHPSLALMAFLWVHPAVHADGLWNDTVQPAQNQPAWFNVNRDHPNASLPESGYFSQKERGWFWYEPLPEPQQEEQEPPQTTPAIPPKPLQEGKTEDPKPLTSAWFRKNMEAYRDKAVDNPSPENVRTYYYLQRVMLDKASRFADVSQQASMSDPLLDENARRPLATFGGMAMDEMATGARESLARKLARLAGLWFVFDSTCKFCEKEAGVLKGLENAYGFKILPISRDGAALQGGLYTNFHPDRGQAKAMGVEMVPAMFLVNPNHPDSIVPLGQGLLSGDEIIKRAIALAHEKGWISDTEYQDTRAVKPLMVDSSIGSQVTPQILTQPDSFADLLRSNLRQQLK